MIIALIAGFAAATAVSQGRLLRESEPNNSPATAQVIQPGDSMSAALDVHADVIDYYAIDLRPDMVLQVDVDAKSIGSPLVDQITILDSDGSSVLTSSLGRVQWATTTGGRYFISVRRYQNDWQRLHEPRYYVVRVSAFPALGDPPTTIVSGITPAPWGFTTAPNGDLYMVTRQSDDTMANLLRIDPSGRITTVAVVPKLGWSLAVMKSGDVLVTHSLWGGPDPAGDVLRISPTGAVSVFAEAYGSPLEMVVGPNDEVWVGWSWYMGSAVRHYDAGGTLKQTIPGGGVGSLALSPSGELFSAAGQGVFKVVDGRFVIVGRLDEGGIGGLTFDRDGYAYVRIGSSPQNGRVGRVAVLTPQYQLLHKPYALVHPLTADDGPWRNLKTVKDANGNPTRRVLAMTHDGVVEINTEQRGIAPPPPAPALLIDSVPFRTMNVRATLNDTLRVLDAPTSVRWSLLAGAVPQGVSLDSTTGVLSGVPSDVGYFKFAVRARSASRTGVGTFAISISHLTVLRPPLAVTYGWPFTDTLRTLESAQDVTWSVETGQLPRGVRLEATGILSGVPADSGVFVFTVRATNTEIGGTGQFELTVNSDSTTIRNVAMGVMGVSAHIPASIATLLDLQGNKNGILDVGDFRAYLRTMKRLP